MKLSIVIPAYNEEKRIRPVLQAYQQYFAGAYGPEAELIVVVNGSSDTTAAIARSFCGEGSNVKVIEETASIGKGGAIMVGFRAATGACVGFVDADGSTAPDAFDDLARNLGDAGLVIASRWLPESVVEPRQPLKRRVASRIFNFLVRTLFGMRITDTQCGAKVLSRAAVDAILPHLGITRWAFDVDLLFQVHRAGFPVVERATVWRDEAGSRLRVMRASVEMLVAIVRLRLIYSPLRWVVSVYDVTIGRMLARSKP